MFTNWPIYCQACGLLTHYVSRTRYTADRLLEHDPSLEGRLDPAKAVFTVKGCSADRLTRIVDCVRSKGTAVVVLYGWETASRSKYVQNSVQPGSATA